jgi:U3 small nucleolar RNA-associated protein 14
LLLKKSDMLSPVAGKAHDRHEERTSYDRNTADVERWKPALNPRVLATETELIVIERSTG